MTKLVNVQKLVQLVLTSTSFPFNKYILFEGCFEKTLKKQRRQQKCELSKKFRINLLNVIATDHK